MTAKPLMIQGTGSGVGKSIITAGLCRHFYKQGYKVAPFKAQNMSLNSFITKEGGEMGRAQVYQAEACNIEPHVAMNPVLMKPCEDNLSQVIVMGKVYGQRNAKDYYLEKPTYVEEIDSAYNFLNEKYEIIVLEGAGSPAEINLKHKDFVNMFMAKKSNSPVLLVGDIDRGGVFAWLKGTVDLLDPEEQDRIAGFIINKFRGDIDLLKPGLKQLEDMTGKPVLGVLPFDHNLFVDEEDAIPYLGKRENNFCNECLDIAVLRFPRISNFTDMSPLVHDPNISLRYIWNSQHLGSPDLIILPGSKNTIADLQFLKKQNLDSSIKKAHKQGTLILGICGGFQMMGETLSDPDQLDGRGKFEKGLGLFKLETTFQKNKITKQVQSETIPSPLFKAGLPVEGYEIHMGQTVFKETYVSLFKNVNTNHSETLGVVNTQGDILGTYLHGILDKDSFRNDFLNYVRKIRGKPLLNENWNYQDFRYQQLDKLENLISKNLDLNKIYNIMGLPNE